MAVNKVVMNTSDGAKTLIDLTGDSVTPETLAEGVTAHDSSGAMITGTARIVDNLGGNSLPNYWEEYLPDKIAAIRALQEVGGKDVVNFAWFSDIHYGGDKSYTGNVGKICATVMDACDIPITIMCGDTLTAAACKNEELALSLIDTAKEIYAPIGDDRLLLVKGNHEDVYGTSGSVSFVNKIAPETIWNKLFRAQSKDFRRVFGAGGSYFYVDNIPQKVRFVCLDSCFYDGEPITNGTTKIMSIGYGTEQLDWLENEALSVADGWSVVIVSHIPPIAEYETHFTDTTYDRVRSVIAANADNIIAIFCGHIHRSNIYTDELPCPVITVTCAVNTPYDGTASERVAGTITETSIDIVSINKATHIINMTRIGHGSDRVAGYAGKQINTNLFVKDKVLLNARVNSSRKVATQDGCFITNVCALPLDYLTSDCYLYLKGIPFASENINAQNKLLMLYSADKDALAIGDVVDISLQFNLTTNLGVKWETLDANSGYYRINLKENAAGTIQTPTENKAFALAFYMGSTALTIDDVPDIIMSFEPIE